MKRTSIQILSLFALAAALSGCALTTDRIGLTYVPQTAVAKVPGADGIQVAVKIVDERIIRDKVGAKKNSYGMDMAPIVSTTDVAVLIKSALETELHQRGFSSGNAVVIQANLTKFYNEFKIGFWAGDSIAELLMTVQVRDQAGTSIFIKIINTEGQEPNIQVCGGANAKIALEVALKKGIEALVDDTEFTAALIKAGTIPNPVEATRPTPIVPPVTTNVPASGTNH